MDNESTESVQAVVHGGGWKQNLYLLQERAPKPKPIECFTSISNRPPQYGPEFHGLIERIEAEKMLRDVGEGAYLVRASTRSPDAFTLCFLFDGHVLNYKLYYDGTHYVGEKRFETIDSLVQDGLISMYIERNASEYIKNMADEAIYEHSPYSHYNRSTVQTYKIKPIQARCHNFATFTFKMPHYCKFSYHSFHLDYIRRLLLGDYCRNFLWGIVQQGVRCSDCGFSAHKKCSEKARHDCHPEARYVKRTFAVDIASYCIAHSVKVPPVVVQCIDEVEKRGICIEGIYRVSGSHEQMDRLRRQFDLLAHVDLSQVEDIHTVAGLLKLYLRLLPQQLVPLNSYRCLLKAYNTYRNADRIRNCRKVLEELNESNRNTLRALLSHLRIVAENCSQNKMSAENLATIFSPTLFCTGTVPALPQEQHKLLHFLIISKHLIR